MNNLFNSVYKGKRVLITGHTGFKGSWLALWLSKLGADVVGYSIDIPTNPSHFELLNLEITSVMGDIVDKQKLEETIEIYRPEIIFHMAAQPIVRVSYTDPVGTFETNIMGTVNLLESCRKLGLVKAIVNVTSDKCYQNKELTRGYTEDDPMGGDDPYSASKGCAELVANSYRNSFFNVHEYGKSHWTLLADARAGNVIGGGDWAKERLIPDLIKAASKDKVAVIRNPWATRPWQHVLEPLSGYLHLGWKLLEGEKKFADNWNFGSPHESALEVNEVIINTRKYWNKIRYEIKESSANFYEANLLKLDSTKARVNLKWKNVWDCNKAFEKTITWYKNFYDEDKIVSMEHLDEYIHDAKRASLGWTKV